MLSCPLSSLLPFETGEESRCVSKTERNKGSYKKKFVSRGSTLTCLRRYKSLSYVNKTGIIINDCVSSKRQSNEGVVGARSKRMRAMSNLLIVTCIYYLDRRF